MVVGNRQLYYRAMLRATIAAVLLAGLPAFGWASGDAPAYILRLPPSIPAAFVADTGDSRLYRFRQSDGGVVEVDTHYMSIGQNGVGKQRHWDRRTPLGVYFVSDDLETEMLHPKYGDLAFPLDYPGTLDRLAGRSGDGIWLHGVDDRDGRRPALDTDGCLALPNENLATIAPDVQPLSTPVIIARGMRFADAAALDALADEIVTALDAWAQSYASGDLHRYFSLYANDFRFRDMSRDEWLGFRTQAVGSRKLDEIQIADLVLLAEPEEEGIYVARFEQTIVAGDSRVISMKRLYWERQPDGSLKIIAEDNG